MFIALSDSERAAAGVLPIACVLPTADLTAFERTKVLDTDHTQTMPIMQQKYVILFILLYIL